jgi:hypothetical protein
MLLIDYQYGEVYTGKFGYRASFWKHHLLSRNRAEIKFGIIQFSAHLHHIYEHRLSPLMLLSCWVSHSGYWNLLPSEAARYVDLHNVKDVLLVPVWGKQIQCTPLLHVSRPILILSLQLHLGFPSDVFYKKLWMHFAFIPCALQYLFIKPAWVYHPKHRNGQFYKVGSVRAAEQDILINNTRKSRLIYGEPPWLMIKILVTGHIVTWWQPWRTVD